MIVGDNPRLVIRRIMKKNCVSQEMIAKQTGIGRSKIGKMLSDDLYANGIIDRDYVKMMNFLGYNVELVIHALGDEVGIAKHIESRMRLVADREKWKHKRLIAQRNTANRKVIEHRNKVRKMKADGTYDEYLQNMYAEQDAHEEQRETLQAQRYGEELERKQHIAWQHLEDMKLKRRKQSESSRYRKKMGIENVNRKEGGYKEFK